VKVLERERVRDWGVSLTETPENDDRRSELGWTGDGATTALAAIARCIVTESERGLNVCDNAAENVCESVVKSKLYNPLHHSCSKL